MRVSQSDGVIAISVTTHGITDTITCSEYNATRVLVSLCVVLGVPYPKALGKLPM